MDINLYEDAMQQALIEARKGRWRACPNPTVGAVLLNKDGQIVARGYHHRAGEAHAEVMCLNDAREKGIDPKGLTMVVTLEPCNHTGRTGPCSDVLIEAGLARVVVGRRDPNPVAKGGISHMRAAGLEVIEGVCEHDCTDLIADFLTWQLKKRPFVFLKLATTLDGHIATRTGDSRWVTSADARADVHRLRKRMASTGGAVLVGANTFWEDNPALTARTTPIPDRQPLACVVTHRLPSAEDNYKLIRERPAETVFFTTKDAAQSKRADGLRELGVRVVPLETMEDGHSDLEGLLAWLWEQGCPYVLCEGGGHLGLSLLEAGLMDMLLLHIAPKVLGDGSGTPLFDGRKPITMDEAIPLRLVRMHMLGEDLVLRYFPKRKVVFAEPRND